MKRILLMALPLMATAFVSCSDDDENVIEDETIEYETITFEDCEFPEGKLTNVVQNTEGQYVECGMIFKYKDQYTMDIGDVVSSQAKIQDSGTPLANAVALDAETEHPGADGSDKFVVVNYTTYPTGVDPEFVLEDGEERQVVSLDLMNSTQMYEYMKYGFYSYTGLADGDWCKVTFTGVDAEGNETGSVEAYLGDFRDGKTFIMEDWTNLDISALGKVNKISVLVTWSDTWNKPSSKAWSVCVDNIKMVKEAAQQ